MSLNTRSIVLLSHSRAGKTSILESILFKTTSISRLGSVDEGTSAGDYNKDEIERKITINSKIFDCNWNKNNIFLIDTPGYADFVAEVIGSLHVVEGAVMLVNAGGGIEVGTERVWKFLNQRKIPRLIIINKLDKENTDFETVLNKIRDSFGKHCVPINVPIGKEISFKGVEDLITNESSSNNVECFDTCRSMMLDGIAELDDGLLEKYLEGQTLTAAEIKKALRQGVCSGKVVPVLCGSATKNIGTEELLSAVIDYLPAADEGEEKPAKRINNEDENITVKIDPAADFTGFVFKNISDPYVGQLTVFKVISGTLKKDSSFYNVTKGIKEKFGQLYKLKGKIQYPVDQLRAGEIGAIAKLKQTTISDSLCDERQKIIFPAIVFPEPAISFSIKPKSRADEDKISGSLHKLMMEDATFKAQRDNQTKEEIISGMGDLHLDIMVKRLKDRFGVNVDIGTPKIAYKETIMKKSSTQYKYKKQSGGRGQYGDVWLELNPLERGKNFEFVNKIVGGVIPRQYIPAVEKGVKEAMTEGVIAGYPVVDIEVTLFDGSYHTVDSSELAFKLAGKMAFKKAMLEAAPVLLEPIMNVDITVPDDCMGDINGDLSSRRGRVMGMDSAGGGLQTIKAQVPIAEMSKYASDLKSMTGGRGSYHMEFSHYYQVPQKIANSIIEKAKTEKEEAKA